MKNRSLIPIFHVLNGGTTIRRYVLAIDRQPAGRMS